MSRPFKNTNSPSGKDESHLKNLRNVSNDIPTEMNYEASVASTRKIAADLLQLKVLINSPNKMLKSSSSFNSHHSKASQASCKIDRSQTFASRQYNPLKLSQIEEQLLKSFEPIPFENTEEIVVLGQRGHWLNKRESTSWIGEKPLCEYEINQDSHPEVITKKPMHTIEYIQELAIRYLKPPSPPVPGEIIIRQERNRMLPPAPPLIIRQQPPRPITPEPIVIREAPPPLPPQIGRKIITISSKRLPPPPRKVIIERLAPLPAKPQSVIIERWLPYNKVKRRVIFQRANESEAVYEQPKNIIIQWEPPQIALRQHYKDLGVIQANPKEYIAKYGASLKKTEELPPFVLEIRPPCGISLAEIKASNKTIYDLEGDLEALSLIDLDKEGLGEYKDFIKCLTNEKKSTLVSVDEFNLANTASYTRNPGRVSESNVYAKHSCSCNHPPPEQ